jgi:hypothetical protein
MFSITTHHIPALTTSPSENNRIARGHLIRGAAFAAALVLEASVWLASKGSGWPGLLSAVAFVLTAALGLVSQVQARAARRWTAALDAYAGQEIVRAQRWKELARAPRGRVVR